MSQAETEVAGEETPIYATKPGVPRETITGNRQYSVRHLLEGGQVPGVSFDMDSVLDGFQDCPGVATKGKNPDGTDRIVGKLGPRGTLNRNFPVQKEAYIPAINEPCPDGCGGTLIYLNPQLTRCDNCGRQFRDNSAR